MPKLKLEKGMYEEAKKRGISFTMLLEELDAGDENLDAFEKQLMEHGLKVTGKQVALVEDFYKTSDSRILFPEFINRNVLIGMDLGRNECMLSDIVGSSQEIQSISYQGIEASTDSAEKGAYRVGEKAEFPVTLITYAEKGITLAKFGHRIDTTYEVLRRIAVNNFALHLQLIGRKIRRSMVEWALDVLVNGDGNSNPAPVFSKTTLNYDNLVDFDMEWEDYEADVWVGPKAAVAAILKLTEFKDPQAGFNYQATGKLISPIGVTLRKFSTVAASTIIGVDKSAALEQVTEAGSQLTESEKIIDKQFEQAVISQVGGFKKIYTNASCVWDYS
jgi:hypothetical protein